MKRIVIDTLGGDNGPEVIVLGALNWMKKNDSFNVLFVGNKELIDSICYNNVDSSRYEVIEATRSITNNDSPMIMLHDADDSSMAKALMALKDEDNIGLVSTGCTGCLLVGSIFKVGLMKGLKFPYLAADLVKLDGSRVCLTDCGANIDSKETDLVNFAKAGASFIEAMYKIPNPKIGLLSVGKEDKKGNEVTKKAFPLLKESGLNFIGNIEGNDVFTSSADVVVCDGFIGNVVLKNAESVADTIMTLLNNHVTNDSKEIEAFKHAVWEHYSYNDQAGSIFLGTNEIIVKGHGCANSLTIENCINQVVRLYEGNLISSLKERLG